MGGVDIPSCKKRGKQYYQKIFFHLLDQALYNSFDMYDSAEEKNHLNYRIAIVQQNRPNVQLPGPGPPSVSLLCLTGRHFPEHIPPTADKKYTATRQCFMCCHKTDEKRKRIRTPSGEILLQSLKQIKVTWCEIRTEILAFPQPRVAIWFCVAVTECGLALSSNDRTPDLRSPGRFFRIAPFNFDRVSQYRVALMVPTSKKSAQK
ncbi:hypothetical protein TNCV_3712311 [Trichonephila clavipes]|nr:hypothetical protein TNCV_3712311 [Trichonephila clavipes]